MIDLSHNNLSGRIPPWLNMTSLHKRDYEVAGPTAALHKRDYEVAGPNINYSMYKNSTNNHQIRKEEL